MVEVETQKGCQQKVVTRPSAPFASNGDYYFLTVGAVDKVELVQKKNDLPGKPIENLKVSH